MSNHARRRPSAPAPRTLRERGAAAVEMAIIFPLLFLLIGASIDFGRAYFALETLTNAAREGTRVGVITGTTTATIQARTVAGGTSLITATDVTVIPCAGSGTNVTVNISMPFTWMVLGPAMRMIGAGSTLPTSVKANSVARCL